MANYFSYLPDVFVRTKSYRTGTNDPYVLAKNLFRRIKIRDDLSDVILGFEKYTIQNNERPDQVAEKVYGNVNYDWVVLLVNNIINVYDEWPMTEQELYNYMVRKYGKDDVESIHHWVTQEVRSARGDLQLRADMQVPENFTYTRPDGTVVPKEDLVRPMSNYDYESGLNDYKRGIHVLKPQFLNSFVEEFEDLVEYLPSNEVDPLTGLKKSVDTVEEAFTSVKPTYQTLWVKHPLSSLLLQQNTPQEVSDLPILLFLKVMCLLMVALLQSQQVTQLLLLRLLAPPLAQKLTNMDPLDLLVVRPLVVEDLAVAPSKEGPPMVVVEEDTKSVLYLLLDVAILSNYPHVALLARFVGILLLDQIRFQTLFGQNVDLGDIQEIRLLVI